MSTTEDYIEFVKDQLHFADRVRVRKMFGEYMVYIADKPALLVCDNTVFVKKLPELAELFEDAECGYPYDGAKEHYILDIENGELVRRVVPMLESLLPPPKAKKRREK